MLIIALYHKTEAFYSKLEEMEVCLLKSIDKISFFVLFCDFYFL